MPHPKKHRRLFKSANKEPEAIEVNMRGIEKVELPGKMPKSMMRRMKKKKKQGEGSYA